ncbi:MAG: helix-turn-helix transcriptional regulator [Bacteroidaceae bacterium]|nr:helix-turn-helix transcriptional regulator [Bacteroidaceae bacterium]
MNTKVTWIDTKRVLVETPLGDDFVVGFSEDSNYYIEKQSVFNFSQDFGRLFDYFYKGDSRVILGEINRQLMLHCYCSIFFYSSYEKTEKDDERIRIGKRIKEIRLEKGLDVKTLAAVAGIDAANLCRIEVGKYSVGFDVISKIAKVCGKKVDFVELEKNDYECIINKSAE